MKQKILCPCDFSLAALQGAEFAALVANRINADITLFYVQPSVWPEAIFLEPEVEDSMEYIESRLSIISENLIATYAINCQYEMVRTTDSIDNSIGLHSSQFDLIVMGTNGTDDIFDYLFGTHSFHVSRLAQCPVLLVPENQKMKIPDTMVYIHRENMNPDLDIYTPLWWSVLLDINFGIWISPSGDETTDQLHHKDVMLTLMGDKQEKLVSFVEIASEPEADKQTEGFLYTVPLDKLHLGGNKEGRTLLKKLSQVAANPIFIYGIH
jgi:nucleotide-binding universal stress UspA family protein